MRESPLARVLLGAYGLVVAYASLYPLQGWLDRGLSPLAYVTAPWPRPLGAFDIVVNVLAYMPWGALAVLALQPALQGRPAVALAALGGALLSLVLEAAQTYLPSRTASNLDLLCNSAGALSGALLARPLAAWVLEDGPLKRLRARWFLPGTGADLGLVLIALWLVTQLNPGTLMFGAGDLRDSLIAEWLIGEARAHEPRLFVGVEALAAAGNLAALGLLLSALVARGRRLRAMLAALVLCALVLKTAAFAVLMQRAFAWLTPGALLGIAAGLAIAYAAFALPLAARLALAAVLLMATTVLVNLAPPNPYHVEIVKLWRQGQFVYFNGLSRLVTALWPFLALGYITYLAARRPREPLG